MLPGRIILHLGKPWNTAGQIQVTHSLMEQRSPFRHTRSPCLSHRLPTPQAPTPAWRGLSPANLLFLLGLVSSQVSLSCTFPQLFPPSLISGSFLSLFSHLSFYFVFRENARNVLTWPTGTELHMESSPHGKESANPDRRPQDLCEETAQDRPSFRCSRGKGPKAGNRALSWHCQEARVVGLESPNREKRAVATRKWRRDPRALSQKGTGVREPPLPGTASPDSNSSRSSQGEWCSCGQLSKCWIQRGPWEKRKRLNSGTNHGCLSFTTGSEAGPNKLALQNTDLAVPSKPGPFQQLPLCPEPPRPPS